MHKIINIKHTLTLDQTVTNWTCTTDCTVLAGDKYPSCKSNAGSRMYCLDQIMELPVKEKLEGNCDPKYKKISPYHTACLPPVPYVVKTGMSDEDKKAIIDLHNWWRRNVTMPAAAMRKLVSY